MHRLTGLYGYKARAHQTGQHFFGGNKCGDCPYVEVLVADAAGSLK